MTGFDGPITIARAAGDRLEHLGRRARRPSRRRTPRPRPAPPRAPRIMNSWKRPPARRAPHPRAHRVVAHRQHARPARRAPRPARRCASVSRAPSARRRARCRHDGEVAVAEVEPHVARRARAGPSMTVERVAAQAPAALVDAVGQPERDEVRVGGDVRAVDLDVVAGVGDRRPGRSPTTSSIPRASLAPPVPPARTTTAPRPQLVGQPGDADARRGSCSGR